MDECKRLARQYELALEGGAWHGPAWREVIEGVDHVTATTRPYPDGHSIAEIVLHTTTWLDVVRQRLMGESPQVSDADDWPAVELADEAAWQVACQRLFAAGQALREVISTFGVERMSERRPGLDDTWYGTISGEFQHLLYHAGQITILRRSPRAGTPG